MRVRIIDGPHEGRWLEFDRMPERSIQLSRRVPFDPAPPLRDGPRSLTIATLLYATDVYEIRYAHTGIERDPRTGLLASAGRIYWYTWREPRITLGDPARIDPARWSAPTGMEGH